MDTSVPRVIVLASRGSADIFRISGIFSLMELCTKIKTTFRVEFLTLTLDLRI